MIDLVFHLENEALGSVENKLDISVDVGERVLVKHGGDVSGSSQNGDVPNIEL